MSAHRLALALGCLTFVLLVVGGTVNPTGSSLACPDWPLCYGQVFPPMEGGVLYEHTHRLVAAAVGLLACVVAVVAWRTRRDAPTVRRQAASLVPLVVLQGVLGGITVIYRLPTLVSTAHLGLSMIFFLLVVRLCWWSRPEPLRAADAARGRASGTATLAGVATLLVYLQVLAGGLVRHTGAGRACGGAFPLCDGQLWPAWPAAQLHQGHRLAGLLLAVVVVAAGVAIAQRARREGLRVAWVAGVAAPVLVVVQVLLGIATVVSDIGVVEVTAHLAVGALLLADLFLAWLALRHGGAHRAEAAATGAERTLPTGATT